MLKINMRTEQRECIGRKPGWEREVYHRIECRKILVTPTASNLGVYQKG